MCIDGSSTIVFVLSMVRQWKKYGVDETGVPVRSELMLFYGNHDGGSTSKAAW